MDCIQSVQEDMRSNHDKKLLEIKLYTEQLLKGASPDMEWKDLVGLADDLIEETKTEIMKRAILRKEIVESYKERIRSYNISWNSSLINSQTDNQNRPLPVESGGEDDRQIPRPSN